MPVFEDFVRIALRDELGLSAREFPTGKACPTLFLDEERRIRLEPDLSWWVGRSCQFIGDVKYKAVNVAGVKHPDVYQLLAYATAAGLPSGLLVYAAGEGNPVTHHVSLAGKLLHVRTLQLEGSIASLHAEIRQVAALLRRIVTLDRAQVA
jgi:5-methylcytosine-specific restriction enzyme subunit McrC